MPLSMPHIMVKVHLLGQVTWEGLVGRFIHHMSSSSTPSPLSWVVLPTLAGIGSELAVSHACLSRLPSQRSRWKNREGMLLLLPPCRHVGLNKFCHRPAHATEANRQAGNAMPLSLPAAHACLGKEKVRV